MSSRASRFLLLLLLWLPIVAPRAHAQGTFQAYSYSVALRPAVTSLGATVFFSTANGNNVPLVDVLPGGFRSGDEFKPRPGTPTIYDSGYGLYAFGQVAEYGTVSVTIPFTDTDGNGFPDFAQVDREVNTTVSGNIRSLWPTPYTAPLSVTVARTAGNQAGQYNAVAAIGGRLIFYSGECDVSSASGSITYNRSAGTLSIVGSVSTQPGSSVPCTASTTYAVQGGNVVLPPMTIQTSNGSFQAAATTLARVAGTGRFRGSLNLQDGNLPTTWPDYTQWMLEINDASDANGNGIPDMVDAPIVAPAILTQPTSIAVTAGQAAQFSVVASGTMPMTYQWQRNGVNLAGATSATLSIPNAQPTNAGDYRVVVGNTAGTVTSAVASLVVNPAVMGPSIVTQPASIAVTAGQAAQFSVVASGTMPMTYQWQRNGVNLAGATSATLSIPNAQPTNAGDYRVVVGNTAGTVTSAVAKLAVNPIAMTPRIERLRLTPNRDIELDILASPGVSHVLEASTDLAAWSVAKTFTPNASTSVLAAGPSDGAHRFLRLREAPVVVGAPVIVQQPADVSIRVGNFAAFSVKATGNGFITYQWFKNGVPISGKTSATLSFIAVKPSDAGTYWCVVSNALGSVTSDAATLMVEGG